jgi:hypothetical protein
VQGGNHSGLIKITHYFPSFLADLSAQKVDRSSESIVISIAV